LVAKSEAVDAPKHFNPEPFAYHHELELSIESLTNRGIGLARADGWVVMVAFALPGEKVRARIFRNHANYSEADLIEILRPSPDRVEPVCPLFGTCGGCQYQQLSYPAQLSWKQSQVAESLEKIGGIVAPVLPPIPSPKEYGYRSKITPHYQRWREDGDFPIGFLKVSQRQRLVDVPACPIATPAINQELPDLREKVRSTPPKGKKKKGATLLLREAMEGVVTDSKELITEKVGRRIFQFKAGEFFQNNPFILPAFAEYVVRQAAKESQVLIDTYCGSGLFSLSAAESFEKVIGIEVSSAATRLADSNAALNGLNNVEFLTGEAESIFSEVDRHSGKKIAVVIDPPRRGCDERFLNQLIELSPQRIVYVSCEPSTQARDLKILLAGGYEIEEIQPFDLFPQTRHIENVVTLVLKEND